MDIIDIIHEEQELDRLLFQEGRTKMNFVKIGRHVINLDTVTEMIKAIYAPNGGHPESLPYVRLNFVGGGHSAVIDKESEPEAFRALMTWMDEQPGLLSDE